MNAVDTPIYQAERFPSDPRRTALAWVSSALVHVSLSAAVFFSYQRLPEGTAPESTSRSAGIALVREIEGLSEYFDDSGLIGDSEAVATESPALEQFLPSEAELAIDPASLLGPPSGATESGQMSLSGRAGDVSASSGGLRGKVETARTRVFGLEGEGNRFVYVFDRSGSMGGFSARPLRAAKAELMQSLDDLQRVHQFQIIFYNEKPKVFNPGGGRAQMMWGDEASKRLAKAFVNSISSSGSTDHLAALRKALALSPDVVFFLTDADEPSLSPRELRTIQRLNRGSTIHTIEFGLGPQRSSQNFLVQLAAQNFGQHIYINIRDL